MNLFNFQHQIKSLVNMSRVKKVLLIMLSDYLLLVGGFWLSLSLRINDFFSPSMPSVYLIVLAPLFALPIFYFFGLYNSLVRYSNYKSVQTITIAITIYSFLWFLLVLIIGIIEKPYDFLIINWLVTIILVGGSRYLARYFLIPRSSQSRRVLIYGAGSAGTQIYSALNYDPDATVVGFVDIQKDLHNKLIEGIKIYSPDSLKKIIPEEKVSEIYIAIPSASRAEIARIIESLKGYGIEIRKLPSIADLASGKIDISDLKKIKIQDLLRREQRSPIQSLLEQDIQNKSVLITGGGGSIGSELAIQILSQNPRLLILFDISEYALYEIEQRLSSHSNFSKVATIIGNVTNQKSLEKIMAENDIQTVYHAAAYKHVPLVEKNPLAGVRCNIFGTLSCINAAITNDVESFVFISTDKAVRPTNVMGATKRFAEQILQSIKLSNPEFQKKNTRISIVRFGNVLGSSGSVVPLFSKQIEQGGPLTVTDPNIIRYFMTIKEASQLVIQAGALGKNGDIFLLDMGEPVKVLDLARDMIRLSGNRVKDDNNPDGDIEISFTGLRPGEKLYEELLIDSQSESTEHEKIYIAKDKNLPWKDIEEFIKDLELMCNEGSYKEIKDIFIKSVDGYNPDEKIN